MRSKVKDDSKENNGTTEKSDTGRRVLRTVNLFISLLAARLLAKHWVSEINKRKSYPKS